MEGIKKVIGNRVYLEVPKKGDSKIYVDHNTKEDLQKEFLKTMNKLKVVAVGAGTGEPVTSVLKSIEIGDMVLVDPSALARAPIIPISPDVDITCVNYYDVMHVWE